MKLINGTIRIECSYFVAGADYRSGIVDMLSTDLVLDARQTN
jgi:hypothetical protein